MKKVLAIILLAAATRVALSGLMEHPGIITPIIGMSIFAGCYLKKWWSSLVTMGAMLASDYIIGMYDWKLMAGVYGSILLAWGLGRIIKTKWYSVALASVLSSLIFFLITNYAVWEFMNWYPHTKAGLIACYLMGIPYLKIDILNDLGWTSAFFGLYAVVKLYADRYYPARQS